jgi:arylsulfotransferase ASST
MLDTAGPSLEDQRPVTQEALSRRVFMISGALLLAFGAFVYGFVAEQRHLWPYELARSSYKASRSLVLFGEIVPEGRRVHAPSDAARESFKFYDASFEAGDLLISLRTIDLVAVVDPDDYRVKWWSNGPWIGQHDPDFASDGTISVYNNTGRGRVLIAVPGEGRAIEVSADGRLLMEFNNLSRAGTSYNEYIEEARWVASDYFPAVPSCTNAVLKQL